MVSCGAAIVSLRLANVYSLEKVGYSLLNVSAGSSLECRGSLGIARKEYTIKISEIQILQD